MDTTTNRYGTGEREAVSRPKRGGEPLSISPGAVVVYAPHADAHGEIQTILAFLGHPVVSAANRDALGEILADASPQLLTVIVMGNLEKAEQQELVRLLAGSAPDLLPIVLFRPATGSDAPVLLNYPREWLLVQLPLNHAQLSEALEKAARSRPEKRPERKPAGSRPPHLFRSLIGRSPAIQRIRAEIQQAGPSDANVLILGESGTGKEVVARNIHYYSKRRDKPFVPVNCGAIPKDLLESELFGHEKGAFTGALTARDGRFAMAAGGTLFLDEIGEMPLEMQVKLLRVLEERTFERVGGNRTIHADVRIVAATNRNLETMVREGKFREDLYYRLEVFPIDLPPLRERIEDLPLLIAQLNERLEHEKNCSVRLSSDAVMTLSRYRWPGNVRELANLMERLAIQHPNGLVQSRDLPAKYQAVPAGDHDPLLQQQLLAEPGVGSAPVAGGGALPQIPPGGLDLKSYISEMEMALIRQALDETGGVVAHAAKLLGLRRTTLAEKMRKYGLSRPG